MNNILLTVNYLIKSRSITLGNVLFNFSYTQRKCLFTKGDFDNITDFDIIRCFCASAVYFNVLGIAGIICNRASLMIRATFKYLSSLILPPIEKNKLLEMRSSGFRKY